MEELLRKMFAVQTLWSDKFPILGNTFHSVIILYCLFIIIISVENDEFSIELCTSIELYFALFISVLL